MIQHLQPHAFEHAVCLLVRHLTSGIVRMYLHETFMMKVPRSEAPRALAIACCDQGLQRSLAGIVHCHDSCYCGPCMLSGFHHSIAD